MLKSHVWWKKKSV